jgi:fatty acid desaturase
MSFSDYMHERAEESRHNETLAYLIFLAGAVFFVGGVLEILSRGRSYSWFLFIPYAAESDAGAFLGLTLIISGICLIIFGLATGIHCSHDRSWYMHEVRKTSDLEMNVMRKKAMKNQQKNKQ